MIPNIDPRKLKKMMEQMGIKSKDIEANKVVISCVGKDIIISNPQVIKIEMQGHVQFQIEGNVEEKAQEEKREKISITDEDVKIVQEKTKKSEEEARKALESTGGDIAKAILSLESEGKDTDIES